MAFNWIGGAATNFFNSNGIIPGTDRHVQNFLWQRNSLLGEETFTANVGNGRTITVTIKDVIRKSGRAKWDVTGVSSDGRTAHIVQTKDDQPDKMKVADAVARQLM